MSNATIGALRVTLGLDSAAFSQGLTAAQKHLKGVGKQFQAVGKTMVQVGAGMSAAITAPLIAAGFAASKAATESADAMGQVEAALKSMGAASGKTKDELAGLASGLMRNSLYDDDEILRKVTANLLTFGNISGKAFDQAQQAAVNLSARLGTDLQASAILVGKALNDPIKGLTAMGRAGIQFTETQKAMIKGMVAAGNQAGAQAIILGELEKQFGGAAAAAQKTDPYDKIRDSLNDLSETVGAIINQYLAPLADTLARLVDGFKALSPEGQKFAVIAAAVAAALGPVLIVAGALVSAIGALLPVLAVVGAPLLAIAAAAAAVGVALYLFRDDIIPIMQAFGAAIAENIGPKIAPLWEALKGAVSALGMLFSQIFGDGSPGGATEAIKGFGVIVARVFGAAIDLITGAVNVVTNIMKALGALLRGDFSAMWGFLGQAVMSAVSGIAKAFQTLFPEVVSWVKKTYEGVKDWLAGKLFEVLKGVVAKIKWVSDAFFKLYDAVVGHSYVPDMVDGIRDEFARLDDVMVKPALAATAKVNAAFKSVADQMRAANDNNARGLPSANNGRGPDAGGNAGAHNVGSSATVGWGGEVFSPEGLAELREQFVGFGKGLVGAIKDGKLGEFFEDIASRFADKLLDLALNSLFDALGKTGGSQGGGLGSVLGSIFGGMKVPGFATGGSFTVGGSGGTDSKLIQFRATPGEMVDIRKPGNDNGTGGAVVFDLRGAVMTQDLLNQMNQISAESAGQVYGKIKGEQAQQAKAARYRVAG